MFKWLDKQTVQHSSGYIVESTGRFTQTYSEHGKIMTINIDRGRLPNGKCCVEIGPGTFLQWDGEKTILPTIEQDRIKQNFIAGMNFKEIEVIIADV